MRVPLAGLIGALVTTAGTQVTPAAVGYELAERSHADRQATALRFVYAPPDPNGDSSTLRVRSIRLESAPPIGTLPSANLKFDLANEGSTSLIDIVVEVAIVQKPILRKPGARDTMIAGPFEIRGKIVLEPGDTIHYQMRLRNLSSDCRCYATAAVLSARSVAAPASLR